MKRFHSTAWFLIPFLALLFLGGCRPAAQRRPPTATPLTLPAAPSPLPTRPLHTPAPSPTPILAPTTSSSIPVKPTPIPTHSRPTAHTPESERIAGWAYVEVPRTALRDGAAGEPIATLSAGQRLEILAATPERAWLYVRWHPAQDAPPQEGWVLARDTRFFVDPGDIPTISPEGGAAHAGVDETPEAPVSGANRGFVIARTLNLRSGPGLDQPVIGKLHQGDEVELLGISDNGQWLQVAATGGDFGWVAARWIRTTFDLSQLPQRGRATTGVPAASPPPRGRILFQDRPGGSIYVMYADGSGLRRITTGLDPAFSPDGQRIAFTRWSGNGDTVRVINVDGSDEHAVIAANKPRSPTWTPDGRYLIYERVVKDTYCRDTPLGCATDEQIRKEFMGNDCWTYPEPIGKKCIWDFPVVHFFITALESASLSGTDVKDLPTNKVVYAPRHHPFSPEVLHLTRDGISVAYTEDDRPPELLVQYGYLGAPVYSPDGRYIYVSRKDGDSWNIWRYNSDGTGPVALTHPPLLRDRPMNNVTPAVSPDGKTILFLTDRRGKWEMWVMNSDGSQQRPFAPRALEGIDFDFDFTRARMLDWR